MPLITLTTDFGASHYAGAMKGAIYAACPSAQVVDITHEIQKYNVRQAAYVLQAAASYFPRGTIHLVVVDPGVGTERLGIIIKTHGYFYTGPDNGVFSFIDDIEKAWGIRHEKLGASIRSSEHEGGIVTPSATFHGRDIFAPVAARLACGEAPENFGSEIQGIKKMKFLEPALERGVISGEVIYADSFGNIITNIRRELMNKAGVNYNTRVSLKLKNRKHRLRFAETYGFAKKGELVCLIGSSDFLEISVNRGSAAEKLKVEGGERVEISGFN